MTRNILLIGMPGSGKTTVGQRLAERLGCPWHDCDEIIEQEAGMSIAQMFEEHGEAHFRRCEADCLRRLQQQRGVVISAGGGAVLHDKALLRSGAVVVYLERSVDSILTTLDASGRPLAQGGAERLMALYRERQALYEGLCDIAVTNEGALEHTIQLIVEELPCDF